MGVLSPNPLRTTMVRRPSWQVKSTYQAVATHSLRNMR